jgi:hypothetical protein
LDWKKTTKEGGRHVFEDLILNNHASTTIQSGYNHFELIQHLVAACQKPIPIESLSPSLNDDSRSPRGRVIFMFPGTLIDQIAYQYQLVWWISARGLNLQRIEKMTRNLCSFDLFVGQFVADQRKSAGDSSRRFLGGILPELVGALDEENFKIGENLEQASRRALADWNQRHPRTAIHSFTNSLGYSWLRRGVTRRIYRAVEKYEAAE